MSNKSEKKESPVRDRPPIARHRSSASDSDAPNLVVSDRAEPDHGRSASGRSLYGPLRARNPLRGRPSNPHDPYNTNEYHAINETARTSRPVNSDTTMMIAPASNPPPYNSSSAFANGARGDSPRYSLPPRPLEWNPAFTTDQTYPSSTALRRQLIASPAPAPATAIADIPATRMAVAPAPAPVSAPATAPAPVSAPATARAVPVTRSTRARAREQPTLATNSRVTQSTRSGAKKQPTLAANSQRQKLPASAATSARKKRNQDIPWRGRNEYGIDRRFMTEPELAQIRPGYGTLFPRKDCFKDAPPGAMKAIECSMTESELLWTLRGARGDKQRKFYSEHGKVPLEDRIRATATMDAKLDKEREKGRLAGHPATMAVEDRFPIVAPAPAVTPAATPVVAPVAAPAVAPIVPGNAAESTEDQEMADDGWVPPPGGLYSDED